MVTPSEQARMVMNPKNACDAYSCTDPKTRVPTSNNNSGSAMRPPSARHTECQRRMATTRVEGPTTADFQHSALSMQNLELICQLKLKFFS